ncbi:hypothetical protein GCM10009560_34150 [Nonomuraea longicatena]|uniref:Uncharacterized protein n=1 Tax=Nonomuraea longicatena TaxID=83682 RepID=A0ABP4A5B3_9ACTN
MLYNKKQSYSRSVLHVRIGLAVLAFLLVLGAVGLIVEVRAITALAIPLAVIAAIDVTFAVRRRKVRRSEAAARNRSRPDTG